MGHSQKGNKPRTKMSANIPLNPNKGQRGAKAGKAISENKGKENTPDRKRKAIDLEIKN